MSIERAAFPGRVSVETRDGGKPVIVGYGAVFFRTGDAGTEYELWPGVKERVSARAFDSALSRRDDARGLFNHDPSHVLGRVSAGTMRLSIDERGLRYEIDPPDTQAGRDVLELIKRGDVTGSSFSFSVDKQSWANEPNGNETRTIESVTLYDVGPVTFPAYEATSTGIAGRSAGDDTDARREYDSWKHGEYRKSILAHHERQIALDKAR